MAQNFEYKVKQQFCTIVIDNCSFMGQDMRIGSAACHDCTHCIKRNIKIHTISCPKIIYRHADGRVIMRKPKK